MAVLGRTLDKEAFERLEKQRPSALLKGLFDRAGRAGAVARKLVEFLEPPAEQLTPVPAPVAGKALIWGMGAKRAAGPLYHGTHTGVLDRILKEGLRPPAETGVRHYTGKLASKQPGVYVTRSPVTAAAYSESAARASGTEPVLLRIRSLPVRGLVADEDALIYPHTGEPYYPEKHVRRLLGSYPASFRLDPDMLTAAIRRALGVSGDELLYEIRRGNPHQLGTAVYVGRIPPERLEVVAVGYGDKAAEKIFKEDTKAIDRIARALRRVLRQKKSLTEAPWWLK